MSEDEQVNEQVEAQIEAKYASLRKEYAHNLPIRVFELQSVLANSEKSPGDVEAFSTALMELHRMKGTLGSYGYFQLSEQVAAVESLLKVIETPSDTVLAKFWNAHSNEIKGLMLAVSEAAQAISKT